MGCLKYDTKDNGEISDNNWKFGNNLTTIYPHKVFWMVR
jgi:hypothetical protein